MPGFVLPIFIRFRTGNTAVGVSNFFGFVDKIYSGNFYIISNLFSGVNLF